MATNTDTELGVINAALIMAGEKKLATLDTTKKSGRTADFLFEIARDECFDLPDNWDFLTTTTQLIEAADEPITNWDHQYILPTSLHRPISMVDVNNLYVEYTHRREFYTNDAEEEFDVILTNENTCYIKYIAARDPAKWPAWFTSLVIINLAMKLVPPLKGGSARVRTSNKLERAWDRSYKLAKQHNQAIGVNSVNGVDEYDGNFDVVDAPLFGVYRNSQGRCCFPGDLT